MIEEKIYILAEQRARTIYKHYRNLFKSNSIDLPDLIQECKVVAIKILNKYNHQPLHIIKLLLRKAINNKCKSLYKISQKNQQTFCNGTLIEEIYEPPSNYVGFNFEQLKEVSSKDDYEFLRLKFLEGMSLAEIGKKIGYSRERARQVYNKIIKKVSKQFKIGAIGGLK